MHADDADVQTDSELQHDDDAFHAQIDAMHGDERLPNVHG